MELQSIEIFIAFKNDDVVIYSDEQIENLENSLSNILENVGNGNYIAIQSFLEPNDETAELFGKLRSKLLHKYNT